MGTAQAIGCTLSCLIGLGGLYCGYKWLVAPLVNAAEKVEEIRNDIHNLI